MKKIFTSEAFIFCFTAMVILVVYGYLKGIDVSTHIVSLVATYIGPSSLMKASNVWAASKDPNADTLLMASKMEGMASNERHTYIPPEAMQPSNKEGQ